MTSYVGIFCILKITILLTNKNKENFVKVDSGFVKTCDELVIGSSEDVPLHNKRKQRNNSTDNNEHRNGNTNKKLSKEEIVAALGSELNSENEEEDDGITKEEKEEIKKAIGIENGEYQFGCGISKMVGPKKQDFWPRITILKRIFF